MQGWIFNGEVFNPSQDELKQYVGFVYEVVDKTNKMRYIGKKNFWAKRTLPPLKGKKRKRKKIVESDWQSYHGSNNDIKILLEDDTNSDRFERYILRLCTSKGEMSYYEAKYQFDNDVLLRDDYYNSFIGCRINASHLKNIKRDNKE